MRILKTTSGIRILDKNMVIRELKDIIIMMQDDKEVNVDINELLEVN